MSSYRLLLTSIQNHSNLFSHHCLLTRCYITSELSRQFQILRIMCLDHSFVSSTGLQSPNHINLRNQKSLNNHPLKPDSEKGSFCTLRLALNCRRAFIRVTWLSDHPIRIFLVTIAPTLRSPLVSFFRDPQLIGFLVKFEQGI